VWHCAEVSAVVCGSVRACTIYSVRQGVRTCVRGSGVRSSVGVVVVVTVRAAGYGRRGQCAVVCSSEAECGNVWQFAAV